MASVPASSEVDPSRVTCTFLARDTWVSEQGDLCVARPTPRVTVLVHRGHLEAGFAPPI
ncbi:MAG TPA: hypothetical protein VFV75_03770 [Candidatus Polarisedimenticolaceae bacterium]|nr:hypothetical protein [Candidatus Polarisedimenticolaceae bacterium]